MATPLTCEKLLDFDLVESIEKKLPPETQYRFFRVSYEIMNMDSFIRDLPSFPGSTDKIIRNELISVIGATLSIEGTVIDKDEIEEGIKKASQGEPLRRKEREADNSRKVYKFIQEVIAKNKSNFEYSESIIKQIHTYFTEDLDYVSNTPGRYRTNFNVTFGHPRKSSLCQTQSDIEFAMKGLITWLNRKNDSIDLSDNPFVKAIMAHYYLTEIHPFADGNGRTARALEALILLANGVNDYCFWSLANFWSSHKDNYIDKLHKIRETLDPIDFIIWGLEGYRDEIKTTKEKVLKKVKQLMFSDYIQFLFKNKKEQKIKLNHRIIEVIKIIISKERISIKKFLSVPEISAFYYKTSQSTRLRDMQKMIRYNLIKTVKDGNDEFIEPNYSILDRVRYNV